MRRHNYHPGFTLVEVLLVLVLCAVLMALAVPALFGQINKARLDGTADQLVGFLQMARLEAMQRGTPVRMRYDPEKREFYLESQPTPAELADGGGGGNKDQETSDDGYIRLTPMWAKGQTLAHELTLQTTLVNPPSLRMLLAELLQQTQNNGSMGGNSTIDNSFTIRTSFDKPEVPEMEGGLIPVEFDPDGTPKNHLGLRIVLTERKGNEVEGLNTDSDQLDPEEKQRWITIEGLTGRIYTIDPPKPIVELANKHQGEEQSLAGQAQGGT